MNWITTIAFAVLLLVLQNHGVESKKHSSPWADPVKAKVFMGCLVNKIDESKVLPQREKEDMENLVQTMMKALSGESNKGKSSAATTQAMNMAFASALAEMVVTEDKGNLEAIQIKTDALINALQYCFKKTLHKRNRKFENEIKELIQMFVNEKNDDEDEDMDFQEDYQDGASIQPSVDIQISPGYPGGAGYPEGGADQWGPSGMPSGSGVSPSQLTSSLMQSKVLANVLGNVKSNAQIKSLTRNLLLYLGTNVMGMDQPSAYRWADTTSSALASLPVGSSPTAYMQLLAPQLRTKLTETNSLKRPEDSKNFVKQLLSKLANEARPFGIRISGADLDSDINTLSSSLPSMQTTVDIGAGYPDGGAGYPDGGAGYPEGGSDQLGPSGMPSGSGVTPSQLVSSLMQSKVLANVLGNVKSNAQIKSLTRNLLLYLGTNVMGMDQPSAYRWADTTSSALASLPVGSSPTAYMQLLAPQLRTKLTETNSLKRPEDSKNFVKQLLSKLANEARPFGIRISGADLDSDINTLSSSLPSMKTSVDIQTSPKSPDQSLSLGDSDLLSFGASTPDISVSGGDKGDLKFSANAILNLMKGLKSPEAQARISNLNSLLSLTMGGDRNGLNKLVSGLKSTFANMKNSGIPASDAAFELLIELSASLMNSLGSSKPDPSRSVNPALSVKYSNDLVRIFA